MCAQALPKQCYSPVTLRTNGSCSKLEWSHIGFQATGRAITDQGTFFLANAADQPLPIVATRDIGAAATALLLDGSWAGRASVPVVGPDNLTPVGMAQVMSDVLARTIRYRQVPVADYKAMTLQHGASEAVAQDVADAIEATNHGIYDTEPRDQYATATTSFRQWCQDILKPAIQD